MKITLLTSEEHAELLRISQTYPNSTFQNKGYEYIDKTKLTCEEMSAINRIEEILKERIDRFSKFFNFTVSDAGRLQLRFDYGYDDRFTGVGYVLLDELLNGFS